LCNTVPIYHQTKVIEYATVAEKLVRVFHIPNCVEVCPVGKKHAVIADVAIVPKENEVILSDKLIDELGIIIEKPSKVWKI